VTEWKVSKTAFGSRKRPQPSVKLFVLSQFDRSSGRLIKQIGVVGAGTMGMALPMCSRAAASPCCCCDVEQRFLDRALEVIAKNLARESAKGKITADQEAAARQRIRPCWIAADWRTAIS